MWDLAILWAYITLIPVFRIYYNCAPLYCLVCDKCSIASGMWSSFNSLRISTQTLLQKHLQFVFTTSGVINIPSLLSRSFQQTVGVHSVYIFSICKTILLIKQLLSWSIYTIVASVSLFGDLPSILLCQWNIVSVYVIGLWGNLPLMVTRTRIVLGR